MMASSPLRYPGGKAKLFGPFSKLIARSGLFGATYCEPYAGGAGLAIRLLTTGFVEKVILNDLDPAIYSFWNAVLRQPDDFCALVETVPLSVEEWRRQKIIYAGDSQVSGLDRGFAAYYLNRTSRSGIIEGAGPIGGYAQDGEWTIDVRFSRAAQIANVRELAKFSDQIEVTCEDALELLKKRISDLSILFYLDPPYYVKGAKLYKNFYSHDDHSAIANMLRSARGAQWVLSYDDVPEIRNLYADFSPNSYSLRYSAGSKTSGSEVMYLSDGLLPWSEVLA